MALAALGAIMPHGLRLRDAVGQPIPWQGRTLVPLYHPGPRAQLHRPFAIQQADFAALGALVHGMGANVAAARADPGTSGSIPSFDR